MVNKIKKNRTFCLFQVFDTIRERICCHGNLKIINNNRISFFLYYYIYW